MLLDEDCVPTNLGPLPTGTDLLPTDIELMSLEMDPLPMGIGKTMLCGVICASRQKIIEFMQEIRKNSPPRSHAWMRYLRNTAGDPVCRE